MRTLLACLLGFALDLLIGDPAWLYHPVRLMGALITLLERLARRLCGDSPKKLLAAGGVLWLLVLMFSAGIPALLLWAAEKLNPVCAFVLETFWCCQLLAANSLKTESMKVYEQLKNHDLAGARQAVSMIVGRDTQCLDEIKVAKAAVETVAENTSDGVVAPLLYMILGGAVWGFAYKAINTMDSMLGYKEERYLFIGRVAARADDAANYIPARITAFLMIAAAYLLGLDGKNARRIFRRDRYKHSSPNSAQTEAVCAGALDIQLAGDAWYFGRLYRKEQIGDALRETEAQDIPRAVRLMYATAWLAVLVFAATRLIVLLAI